MEPTQLMLVLAGSAAVMTALVRVLAFRERWSASGWAVVYLGSALALGGIWMLAFG